LYSQSDEKPHFLKQFSVVVDVTSPGFCNDVKSCEKDDLHFGCITEFSSIDDCYCLLYQLLSVPVFDSMDDPHIQWLQMAFAIWG